MLDPEKNLLDEVRGFFFGESLLLRDEVEQLPSSQPAEQKINLMKRSDESISA